MPEHLSLSGGRPIGYQITHTYCRECAPEGLREFYAPMREREAHGVPFHCDTCDRELKPCAHEWGEWRAFVWGGEFRVCNHDFCGEAEYRDLDGTPTTRPPMPPIGARPA